MPAYVDESGGTSGGGLYVMAAVAVPSGRCDEVRAALRSGLPRGLRRYHWRDERTASRVAMTRRVRDLGLDAVAVTTSPVEPRKTERARRHCLLRLLWELEQRGETEVVLESRARRDAHDRRVVAAFLRSGQVSPLLRYDFTLPKVEPLLWLPDVVAGAVACARGDQDATYVGLLADRLDVVEVF